MTKFIPKRLTRFGARSVLKAQKNSPTILVVAGTIGLVATAVVAVKASRKGDEVVQEHKAERNNIGPIPNKAVASKQVRKDVQVQVVELYYNTGLELVKVYGPTLALGVVSVGSILYGHKILRGRHAATVAAYSGLLEQFTSYRGRVRQTLGEKAERDIYNGAHGERVEDPDHPGEYNLQAKFPDTDPAADVTRPWFQEGNPYFKLDPEVNMMHLNAVQNHLNNMFQVRGHLFLNEVNDALHLPRSSEGQVLGWVLGGTHKSDGFIDFGHTSQDDPITQAFRNKERADVRLCFNVDGYVHDLI